MITLGGNSPGVLHRPAYRALQRSLSSPPQFLPIKHATARPWRPALAHSPVSQSVAENCTLEPVVLQLVTTILSILQLPGWGAALGHWHRTARRWLRYSARLIMERVESFSWHTSSVNNRGNTACSARQRQARTPAPAFTSPLLSKSFEIEEAALESSAVWKE